MVDEAETVILNLTVDIVASHVSHNRVGPTELPALISSVFETLASLGKPIETEAPVAEPTPAVSVRSSIKPDYIICLEDGKKLTMLKRYLQTRYGLTPQQYRTKWNLPADYPMVAPKYAERRRELAKAIGLGRKPATPAAPVAAKPRGRRKAPATAPTE